MARNYGSYYTTKNAEYNTLLFPNPTLKIDVDYLAKVHSVQTKSYKDEDMMEFIRVEVNAMQDVLLEKDSYGNWYVTKGKAELYPCMVSHTDTVHDIQDSFNVFRDGDVLFAFNKMKGKQAGIGGDDKVGVFMTLTMLKLFPVFKAVFFRNEEVGCLGSGKCDMTFFDDVTMVLQCDRKGSNDFVSSISSTELQSDAFKAAVKPILDEHFYTSTSGGMTDVQALKRAGLEVVCANMSCGYYSPHSSDEVVHIPSVENTMNMCIKIYKELGNKKWEHKYTPYVYKSTYSSSSTSSSTTNSKVGTTYNGATTYESLKLKPTDFDKINALPLWQRQALALKDGYAQGGWTFHQPTGWKKTSHNVGPNLPAKTSKKAEEKAKSAAVEVEEERGWRTVNNKWGRYDDENERISYQASTKDWRRSDGTLPYWDLPQTKQKTSVEVAKDYKIIGNIYCPDCTAPIDRGNVMSMLQAYCDECGDYIYIPAENIEIKGESIYDAPDNSSQLNWAGL